jgi:hypothetical protein
MKALLVKPGERQQHAPGNGLHDVLQCRVASIPLVPSCATVSLLKHTSTFERPWQQPGYRRRQLKPQLQLQLPHLASMRMIQHL